MWLETKRWRLHSAASWGTLRFGSPRQIFLFLEKTNHALFLGSGEGTGPLLQGVVKLMILSIGEWAHRGVIWWPDRNHSGHASEHRPQAETLTSAGWPGNWRACLAVWRKQPRNECFPSLGSLWTCKISQLQRLSGCSRPTKGEVIPRKKEWRTLSKGHVQSDWEVHEDTGST